MNTIVLIKETTISVSFEIGGSGNVNIDWGDRTPIETVRLPIGGPVKHNYDYAAGAVHAIKITGDVNYLNCSNYKITALDIRHNPNLHTLICSNNQLTALSLGSNANLSKLDCSNNPVFHLSAMHNHKLQYLDCSYNALDAWNLDYLLSTLHKIIISKSITITGNKGTGNCDRSIAQQKGWQVIG